MTNLAILVGNTQYRTLAPLHCCHEDILALDTLLKATGKYESITIIENADADSLKTQIRAALDGAQSIGELFFYFTGHGHQSDTEFYFCTTNFDSKRPNESGLSTTELHTLLRLAGADLVVKVVDACNSGTLLVKSDLGLALDSKAGFNSLVQISSCLESQNSLTGAPLSQFTFKFRSAALRKTEGVVYYTDIINTLRDDFDGNNAQTPFFVSQGTGRDKFIEDATKLNDLRLALKTAEDEALAAVVGAVAVTEPPTLIDRLRAADAKVVTPHLLKSFVDRFFDELISGISKGEFADYFEIDSIVHADYREATTERFIIRSLANEKRADNFVTATHERVRKNRGGIWGGAALDALLGNDAFDETWTLSLNCEMSKAQARVTLTPKFINLQQIVLVVSCVPSLDRCYVFEVVTKHRLRDFGKFDAEGTEISRRWWKRSWFEPADDVILQIATALEDAVKVHLEAAEKRLGEGG